MALRVKSIIRRPAEDYPKYGAWIRNNSTVSSWLLNSISKEIATSVIYSDDAATIWNDLHTRFERRNGPRIFQLKKDVVNCMQGTSSISAYYTKFKSMREEFGEFRPVHTCSCGGVKPLLDYIQNDCVLSFLMGLNDNFFNVCGQILLMDPIPSIEKVFHLVSQDEQQRQVNAPVTVDSSLACAVSSVPRKNPRRERPQCSHCGVLGHLKEKCFKLHGYPPAYNKKPATTKPMAKANNVTDAESSEGATTVSNHQYQMMMQFIQAQMAKASTPESDQVDTACVGHQPAERDW